MTELLTVWEEISRAFDGVGEADIRRVQRNMVKAQPDDRPLGALHNESLKKLWAVADRYNGLAKQAVIDVDHKAETDAEASALRQSAGRYAALEEIVRDLFWTQAKDDIGAWEHSGVIGLREDWMLVCAPSPVKGLAELLGSILPPGQK